jgi:hypothetical protein
MAKKNVKCARMQHLYVEVYMNIQQLYLAHNKCIMFPHHVVLTKLQWIHNKKITRFQNRSKLPERFANCWEEQVANVHTKTLTFFWRKVITNRPKISIRIIRAITQPTYFIPKTISWKGVDTDASHIIRYYNHTFVLIILTNNLTLDISR